MDHLRLYSDNIHSFAFSGDEGREVFGREEVYKKIDERDQQIVCYKLASYNNNLNKQKMRCNLELDFIHPSL